MADLTVRRLEVRATSEGVDALKAKLEGIATAQTQVARAGDALGFATETLSRRQLSAASSFERLQRNLDGSYAAQQRYAASVRDLDRATAQGLVTEQRRAELLGFAATKFGTASVANENFRRGLDFTTRQSGLARHELINLGRQAQDVGTMFAMGATPMQVFASQAAQIGDIFMSTQGSIGGFLRQVGGGLARFATSGLGLAAGAGAAGIWGATAASGYADGQREIERALRGVGAASGATLDQINRLAEAQASAARVSRSSAREIAAAFAGTGRVNPTALPGLLDFSKQYSAMQGLTTADAAKELAGAFADPSRGAETLAEKLGGLNSAALRSIRDQQAAGDMLGAQRTLLETFAQQVQGSTDRVGLFAAAWDGVKRSVSDADDALGRFLAGTQSAEQRLDELRRKRDLFPSNAMGARNQQNMLDAEIRKLEAIVELDRQRAAIEERTAKAANASRLASGISSRVDTYGTTLRDLTGDRSKLEEAMRLNPRAGEYDEWATALGRVTGAISTLIPTAERERQTHELTMRAISARTLAERTAIEVAREGLRLSGEKVSAAEREIAMQRKAAEVQAQASRDAQDALRASRDALAVSGRSPGERARIEIDQRYRDNVERFGGASVNTTMPATTAAANGLDAAFAESLRQLQAAVPGLTITSGFRSYDQQAKLYAEKPGWAARPGTSNHERGMAADLAYNGSGRLPQWVRDKAGEFGISFPLANRARNPEPWHAEPSGGRSRAGVTGGGGVADEIRRNELTAFDRNAIEGVIGNSTRQLQQQQQQLDLSRQSWGATAEEIAKAAKSQELINSLQQAGATITPELRAQVDQVAAGYGRLAQQTEQLKASRDAMQEFGNISRSALSGFISDIRSGVSGAEAFRNSLNRVADKLIDMALNDLFGKAFGNNSMGLFGGNGLISGLFGGFGGGGGLTAGSGGLYAEGGFTGYGSKWQPAGVVHRGEVVWSQADVSRAGGVAVVDAMRRGLPGYASGGTPGYIPPAAPASSSGKSGLTVNVINKIDGAQVETRQDEAGNLELVVGMVEGNLGRKAARGQGPLAFGLRQSITGSNLRG